GDGAGAGLVLEPDGRARLYVDPPSSRETLEFFNDPVRAELWVGRRPELGEIEEALGLPCSPLSELGSHLAGDAPTRVLRGVDAEVDALVPPGDPFPDRELRAILSELRLVKDAWE